LVRPNRRSPSQPSCAVDGGQAGPEPAAAAVTAHGSGSTRERARRKANE